jgi:hypothetical protein
MDWDDPALTPIVREKVIVDHYKQVSWKDVFAVGGHPHTPDDNVTAMLPLGVSKFEPSKLAHIESVVKAFAPWFHYIADTSPVGLQFDPTEYSTGRNRQGVQGAHLNPMVLF